MKIKVTTSTELNLPYNPKSYKKIALSSHLSLKHIIYI